MLTTVLAPKIGRCNDQSGLIEGSLYKGYYNNTKRPPEKTANWSSCTDYVIGIDGNSEGWSRVNNSEDFCGSLSPSSLSEGYGRFVDDINLAESLTCIFGRSFCY